jgi:inhibitor of cysteine peptidase
VPDFTLTEEDSGKPIEVSVGTRVNIRLQENPTTGYRWSLRDFNGKSLALESDEYLPTPSSAIGEAESGTFYWSPQRQKGKIKHEHEG